eukprot:5012558-Pleurochrysis_carterae.AAC.1
MQARSTVRSAADAPASMNCIAPIAMAALSAATFSITESTAHFSSRRTRRAEGRGRAFGGGGAPGGEGGADTEGSIVQSVCRPSAADSCALSERSSSSSRRRSSSSTRSSSFTIALSDGVGDTLGGGSSGAGCAALTGRPCATGAAVACALGGGAKSAGCAAGERKG